MFGEVLLLVFMLDGFIFFVMLLFSLFFVLVVQWLDVLQVQVNLYVVSVQIGVVVVSWLLQIEFIVNVGCIVLVIGEVFKFGMGFWNFGVVISVFIFQGGVLMYQECVVKVVYVQEVEQYCSMVFIVFQNVVDVFFVLQQDVESLKVVVIVVDVVKIMFDLFQCQWKDGYVGYFVVFGVDQSYQQVCIVLVQVQVS